MHWKKRNKEDEEIDMPKISIIVPVYKVEKYIDRCIKSLVNQTLKDIEIILVDDGSPDSCPNICDDWAKKDQRIKVVHKENGGLSSARNAGVRIATGKYVGFVDSDDDVELDMYEKMYHQAQVNKVDFVMCDYQRILNDHERYIKTLDIDEGYYSKEKIIHDIYPQLIMKSSIEYGPLLSVWHCLYRLDFLHTHHLEFDEEVRWSEDNIFSAFVGYYAQSFYYMKNEALYHYYQNVGSITTSYRKGSWNVYKTMNIHLHQFFDDIVDYDFSQQLNYHLIYYACNCLNQTGLMKQFKKTKEEISKLLSDKELVQSLHDVKNLSVNPKLEIQIGLMKYKMYLLLSMLVRRRC